MTRKTRRLWLVIICVACFGTAAALMLRAFSSDIVFFVTPSQLTQNAQPADRTVKLGGMVVANSVKREKHGDTPVSSFEVTDGQSAVTVNYEGVLPDLFREGQSVVAIGSMKNGIFIASEVLAKHDETYMPKEVAEALKKSGKWDPRFGPPPDAASWNSMTVKDAKKSLLPPPAPAAQ
ncbi:MULTISPECIES: cytochrome c maturation protein CcmE [Acetobacter]|uniref:Cytochrome c-type biogenesis protein CcmE n=1 Tax=Acetobacter thailandicus TaxID=1502842 RepID=A0ABT3QF24_9PROT|nr:MULTISPECIES: cytochrome c maturation protein CcmE [Acetobacter]MBS0960027.1 cytochrome c maturation protein CcmE [Acetobacter thailandicus]MBS0979356.1 cytochrome c maturation protein CcmE [Acetobacter thailandicus]MBS0985560.1 cytochrome c maturation protein CcmE [Acetobacter thailandicus]MCX2563890.1 cytochrome c maturation protein CcmE [Acetobacter thailandicus]NHN95039.1 cytochrome c maturation protein CcmE [Acetobacter thailandicus]